MSIAVSLIRTASNIEKNAPHHYGGNRLYEDRQERIAYPLLCQEYVVASHSIMLITIAYLLFS